VLESRLTEFDYFNRDNAYLRKTANNLALRRKIEKPTTTTTTTTTTIIIIIIIIITVSRKNVNCKIFWPQKV